jgi:hypothetical protein
MQFEGYRASRFWIASSDEMIRERCFYECKSPASVTFDADTKVSRFDRFVFSASGFTSIHIPSSVEGICKRCFDRCESLISVTRDPGSKLRSTISGLLAGVCFAWR